jgi:hypothetical protein
MLHRRLHGTKKPTGTRTIPVVEQRARSINRMIRAENGNAEVNSDSEGEEDEEDDEHDEEEEPARATAGMYTMFDELSDDASSPVDDRRLTEDTTNWNEASASATPPIASRVGTPRNTVVSPVNAGELSPPAKRRSGALTPAGTSEAARRRSRSRQDAQQMMATAEHLVKTPDQQQSQARSQDQLLMFLQLSREERREQERREDKRREQEDARRREENDRRHEDQLARETQRREDRQAERQANREMFIALAAMLRAPPPPQ